MKRSDFTKQPRGPFAFDFWTSNATIPTSMGEFTIELQMGEHDTAPPDKEMLRRADELTQLLLADIDTVHDMVFEHYQRLADEPKWLKSCGVPARLDRDGIVPYLEVRTLSVSRELEDEEEPYSSRIYVVPAWDQEHAIYLAHDDGEWEFVDC